jgi:hypothetical protein
MTRTTRSGALTAATWIGGDQISYSVSLGVIRRRG